MILGSNGIYGMLSDIMTLPEQNSVEQQQRIVLLLRRKFFVKRNLIMICGISCIRCSDTAQ
jgi:hypothetical protein